MKLFGQILIVAICAYAASGLSVSGVVDDAENIAHTAVNAADNAAKAGESALQSILDKIGNLINSHKPTVPTADTCYSNYNTQLTSVNDQTVSQSQSCYTVAESSVATYTENINASLADVNTLSQQLQSQLAACAEVASIDGSLNCYVSTFDENLKKLDDLTVQSQLAISYLNGYQSEVEFTENGCVSSVILISKANSTIALNTLGTCLDNVNHATNAPSKTNSSSASSSASKTAGSNPAPKIQVQTS